MVFDKGASVPIDIRHLANYTSPNENSRRITADDDNIIFVGHFDSRAIV